MLNWDYDDPMVLDVMVEKEHIDGLGHTNNCEYLKWCEAVAWKHSESLGLGLDTFQKLGYGMATMKTTLEYLVATYQGDELVVGTWIEKCDGKLYTDRVYQVIRKSDGKTVLRELKGFYLT